MLITDASRLEEENGSALMTLAYMPSMKVSIQTCIVALDSYMSTWIGDHTYITTRRLS